MFSNLSGAGKRQTEGPNPGPGLPHAEPCAFLLPAGPRLRASSPLQSWLNIQAIWIANFLFADIVFLMDTQNIPVVLDELL